MDGFDSSIEKVDDKFPYRRVDVAYMDDMVLRPPQRQHLRYVNCSVDKISKELI